MVISVFVMRDTTIQTVTMISMIVLLILVPMVVHVLMKWIVLTVPVLMDTGEIHAVKVRGVKYR